MYYIILGKSEKYILNNIKDKDVCQLRAYLE